MVVVNGFEETSTYGSLSKGKEKLPTQALPCTDQSCSFTFPSQGKLNAHLRGNNHSYSKQTVDDIMRGAYVTKVRDHASAPLIPLSII